MADKYELHPTQINTWKREFLDNSENVFAREKKEEQDVSKEKELYSKIGKLQIQVDFLKKSLGKMSMEEKRRLVCPSEKKISVSEQCKLIGLPRSNYYYKPKGKALYNQHLMKLIDMKFFDCPFYGIERMVAYLKYDLGHWVGEKRIRRLYHVMNRAICLKKNLSKANKADYKYPYLLKGMKIECPYKVWQADITYIPMLRGFMYLLAIIDV
ncbi:hypothetical protein [Sphingobacterium bambusae]|uniref:HTH-like domain-containing protein n=1 Tax=Sphingobacterium bambusae TaxID=662858 RepID=A0ABW6BJ86_9SPHI|nr:hypothetical protein [Sphingobacterium bambusae]WPL49427.1 hypothetical protein SCB77_03035 [Sphingobacterium bambusae]